MSWNTKNEVEFIKGLGMGIFAKRSLSRKEALRAYLKASDIREDWGKIDKVFAVTFAKTALEQLQ